MSAARRVTGEESRSSASMTRARSIARCRDKTRKLPFDEGRAGDNVGVLLRGIEKKRRRRARRRGDPASRRGALLQHKKSEGGVCCPQEGRGAHVTRRSSRNHRPQFYYARVDVIVTGTCMLPEGTKMATLGDNIRDEHRDRASYHLPSRREDGASRGPRARVVNIGAGITKVLSNLMVGGASKRA
jgi:translation elongation factor EF-Tu-like GTPase